MTKKLFLFAASLALAAVSVANAQVDPGNRVAFEWGAIHMTQGQAIVLNLSIGEQGGTAAFPVQFELRDKNGNAVYRNSVMVQAGHTVSLAISTDPRPNVQADIYAAIGPTIRTLTPSVKVGPAGGGTMPPPDSLLTPTLEVMDTASGRVVGFANNPHAIIGVL